MKTILITGGAGFIGSQAGFYFSQLGYEVILLDNLSYGHMDNLKIDGKTFGKFIPEDIRSKNLLSKLPKIDYILHLAGIAPLPDCQANPQLAIDVNVGGTANILDLACKIGVKKVIFTSTSAVYENNTNFPCKENDDVSPDLIYAVSKLQAELLCKSYYETYGLPVTILRLFNVYGPYQDFKRKQPALTGYIIKQLLDNNPPIFYSDGKQKRDYVYINDILRLFDACLHNDRANGEIFNAASGQAYSVIDIYEYMAEAFGYRFSRIPKPIFNKAVSFWDRYPELFSGHYTLSKDRLEKEVNKYALGNTRKTFDDLGWYTTTTLEHGLYKTVQYVIKR